MKKKLFFAVVLVLIACTFTSCSKTCKTCQQVTTYGDGSPQTETTAQEYCGAEPLTIEATPPVTVGSGTNSTTTTWSCN